MNENLWTPALAKVDSTAPPKKAYNAVTTSLRPNGASHILKTPQGPKKKGKGGRKGKHKQPKRNNSTKDKSVWNPPGPGEPQTKQIQGTTYHWCQKCNHGRGRWSTTHGTSSHLGKPPPSIKHNTGTPHSVNLHEVHEVIDDHTELGVWCTSMPPAARSWSQVCKEGKQTDSDEKEDENPFSLSKLTSSNFEVWCTVAECSQPDTFLTTFYLVCGILLCLFQVYKGYTTYTSVFGLSLIHI